MNDMSEVIVPKSDQINADSLIAGPMTVTVKDVKISPGTEQPVSIVLAETPLFFRPCKSMSRVLVKAWGPDAKKYVGHSMTLYRDPDVQWGGVKVGGIRISHMTGIGEKMTMALTATRAQRKPFTVQPLTAVPARVQSSDFSGQLAELKALAQPGNMDALGAKWQEIGADARKALASELPALKAACESPAEDVPFDGGGTTLGEQLGLDDPVQRLLDDLETASQAGDAAAVEKIIAAAEKQNFPDDQKMKLEVAYSKARDRAAARADA